MENKNILFELLIFALVSVLTPWLFADIVYPSLDLPTNTPIPIRTLLVGLLIFYFLRRNGESLSALGIKRIKRPPIFLLLVVGLLFVEILMPTVARMIVPAVPVDYSFFDYIQGNIRALIFWIGMSWIFGGFFEEFIFRGYLFHRIQYFFGDHRLTIMISLVLQAIIFGFFHTYQGPGGIVATSLVGLVNGIAYYKYKNLWLPICSHGLLDTMGFIVIYFNGTAAL